MARIIKHKPLKQIKQQASSLARPTPIAQPALPAAVVPTPPQYAPYDPNNDPLVIAAREAAAARRTSQLAEIGDARNRLNRDFGISQKDGQVDPNNPYSKLAQLQKSFKTAQKANQTSMAARGQLSSGAYQRAQRRASSDFSRGDHELRTAWDDGQAELNRATTRANSEAADADVTALGSYLDRLSALNALVSAGELDRPEHLAVTRGAAAADAFRKKKAIADALRSLR